MNVRNVYDFAVKWYEIMAEFNPDYASLIAQNLTEECKACGFDETAGKKYLRQQHLDVYLPEVLVERLGKLENMGKLGAAFFAHWQSARRHYVRTGEATIEAKQRKWLRLVLARLQFLAQAYPFQFTGQAQALKLISYAPKSAVPESGAEVYQELILTVDGEVTFSSYVASSQTGAVEKAFSKTSVVESDVAWSLLNVLVATFDEVEDLEEELPSVSKWQVTLENEQGQAVTFNSEQGIQSQVAAIKLSSRFRRELGMSSLLLFDENVQPQRVDKIMLWYSQQIEVVSYRDPDIPDKIEQSYGESLEIDRYAETLVYSRGTGRKRIEQRIKDPAAIAKLLDGVNVNLLTANWPENTADAEADTGAEIEKKFGKGKTVLEQADGSSKQVDENSEQVEGESEQTEEVSEQEEPFGTPVYAFTIELKGMASKFYSNSYSKEGLPSEWADFLAPIQSYLEDIEVGAIFDANLYGRLKYPGELKYLVGVIFSNSSHDYWYLSADDSLNAGDFVVVPAGRDNHDALVRIVKTGYLFEKDLPLPIEKLKEVKRRVDDEELDEAEELFYEDDDEDGDELSEIAEQLAKVKKSDKIEKPNEVEKIEAEPVQRLTNEKIEAEQVQRLTNEKIWAIALAQSALDANCQPKDFLVTTNVIALSKKNPQARKYLDLPLACNLISYGNNVVASIEAPYRQIVADYLGNFAPEHCFETPNMHVLNDALQQVGLRVCFMAEYFLPQLEQLELFDCPYELRMLTAEDFTELYTDDWTNALCKARAELDVLGVGAYDNGKLIGLAGCSADGEEMWQIGVDVLPAYRRQGVSAAITSHLAQEILARHKVPFYCAAWSNIKSVRNAIKVGFRPAWVEMTAKPTAFVDGLNERV